MFKYEKGKIYFGDIVQSKLKKELIEELFITLRMGYNVISLSVPNLSCGLQQHFCIFLQTFNIP